MPFSVRSQGRLCNGIDSLMTYPIFYTPVNNPHYVSPLLKYLSFHSKIHNAEKVLSWVPNWIVGLKFRTCPIRRDRIFVEFNTVLVLVANHRSPTELSINEGVCRPSRLIRATYHDRCHGFVYLDNMIAIVGARSREIGHQERQVCTCSCRSFPVT